MTALEKFKQAMNKISPFWTKNIEVTAQDGEIVLIKVEGFCFKSDKDKKQNP
jgi:bisphosphoglycerate-dependent phosphoglycerate mutase